MSLSDRPPGQLAGGAEGERSNATAIRVLGAAQLLGSLSEWTGFTVALVAGFEAAGTSGASAVAVAAVLPAVIVSPGVSYLTDRLRPQRVLSAALLVRTAVLAAATLAGGGSPSVALLAVLVGVEGMSALTIWPAVGTLLPWLVSTPDALTRANFRMYVAEHIGRLAGPALGGVLLGVAGVRVAFGTALIVSLAALGVSLAVRAEVHRAARAHRGQVLAELGQGFLILARERGPRTIAVALGALAFLHGILEVAAVPLAHDTLRLGSWGPGLLIAAVGAGGVLAGYHISVRAPRQRLVRTFLFAAALAGVFVALVGALPYAALAFPAFVLYGASVATTIGLGSTLIERLVAPELVGRVLGLGEAIMYAMAAAGASLVAPLVATVGMRGTLLATGGTLALFVARFWPTVRRIDLQNTLSEDLLQVLRQVPFLAALPIAGAERISRAARTVELGRDEVVFLQGEFGDHFYVIIAGQFEVAVDGVVVRVLGVGDFFGELALLRRIPRTATVTARASGRLIVIGRRPFLEAVTGPRRLVAPDETLGHRAPVLPAPRTWDPAPFLRAASTDAQAESLRAVPLLAGLSQGAARRLAVHAELLEMRSGAKVVDEGDATDAYYVIVTGEVQFHSGGEETGVLGPGHGFGELALLRGSRRTAAAVATTPTILLRFPARELLAALAPDGMDRAAAGG